MAVKIFFCYAHEDEALLNQLKAHLRPLQRQGLIDVWHDRDISAGTEWEQEISQHLNAAQIILLLISPDFMNSDYCYGTEMKRALERHECKEACVIPIILRSVYWKVANLDKLQALPTDAKPVRSWGDVDEAFFNITEGVYRVVEQLVAKPVELIQEPTENSPNIVPRESIQEPTKSPSNIVPQDAEQLVIKSIESVQEQPEDSTKVPFQSVEYRYRTIACYF